MLLRPDLLRLKRGLPSFPGLQGGLCSLWRVSLDDSTLKVQGHAHLEKLICDECDVAAEGEAWEAYCQVVQPSRSANGWDPQGSSHLMVNLYNHRLHRWVCTSEFVLLMTKLKNPAAVYPRRRCCRV